MVLRWLAENTFTRCIFAERSFIDSQFRWKHLKFIYDNVPLALDLTLHYYSTIWDNTIATVQAGQSSNCKLENQLHTYLVLCITVQGVVHRFLILWNILYCGVDEPLSDMMLKC